jgi:hypothetical protein
MQELRPGTCPLHGDALVGTCAWCGLRDRAKVLQNMHEQLLVHVLADDPLSALVSTFLLGHVGDAVAVDATLTLPGGVTQSRRFLVRPDAVLPLG